MAIDAEALEDKAYKEQFDLIYEQFGESAANMANYGWGVSGDDEHLSIATKVYGHGVLVTTVDLESGEINHEMEDF